MTSPSTDTRRHLGPEDAGALLSNDEFEGADWEPGYRYELVAGRLHVTPAPNRPHCWLQDRLADHLKAYARTHRDVLRWVAPISRVLTVELGGPTNVEPDIALYRDLPPPERRVTAHWREVTPLLVVEIVSGSNPEKDLVRNREVYAAVPSIREYWIVDSREDPSHPTLLALVRDGEAWIERPVGPGAVYRTDLLPGLEVDLAAILLME